MVNHVPTILHEVLHLQEFLYCIIKWKPCGKKLGNARAFLNIQIVRECDAVTGRHFEHFMLAVTVECGPLDHLRRFVAPVVCNGFAIMADSQRPAFMRGWQTDDK